ncbi:competence protein CoiA family protein [Metasolibacillus meyeri]|uniref:Competence protein CoiA family protein n=1 Tax=Metasolibacillus meyeri TaxID=1071052 RepID=A0AAW9NSW4_9BACL|nr:competence protein CoiA family protein [Metasolibacillus meyeri]MEC1178814.1 competence protein CoiA family protein [Metasolibacillus meyeri]
MLVAHTEQGQLITITLGTCLNHLQQLRQTTTFYCPQCKQPLQLKIGRVKIPHFAHKQLNDCDASFTEGESLMHLLGKQQLFSFFQKRVEKVVLEGYLSRLQQRPDLFITHRQQHYAIEFQCSTIPFEQFNERTTGYEKHGIIPLWIAKAPNKIPTFGIRKISLSQFYQQFFKRYQNELYLITYDTVYSRFIYFSNLQYVQGRTWLANIQPLPLDRQHFPFFVPKRLTEVYLKEMLDLYKLQRVNFLRTKVIFNRKGLNDLFLRGLYEQRLTYEQLPNYIGIPICRGEAIPLFSAEWQSHVFYFLRIFNLKISQLDEVKIWAFLRWSKLPQTTEALLAVERYIDFLCMLGVESIINKIEDTTLFHHLASELIAFSEKN